MSNSEVTGVLAPNGPARHLTIQMERGFGPALQREVIMKHARSVTEPKQSSFWQHPHRNLHLAFPKEMAHFAAGHPSLLNPWQAHGEVRSFHQAPHPMHISRGPRGG